jgi:hypothetical protein
VSRPRRPAKLIVGPVGARVVRGPHREDSTKWYWQGRTCRDDEAVTVYSGWKTREEAAQEIATLVATGNVEQERPTHAQSAEIDTVLDLLRYWRGGIRDRVDLADDTRRIYKQCTQHLGEAMGAVKIEQVDAQTLEQYRNRRLRAKAAPATVWKELKVLRQVWKWGQERGCCPARLKLVFRNGSYSVRVIS